VNAETADGSFLLWLANTEPGHCVLDPTRIKKVGKLHLGETVAADFGQPIQYRMSDDYPDDIELSDNYVISGQIIVSSRLRQALEPILPADRVQYLRVSIINHKKRVAAQDYSILHLHDVCDCIDQKRSKVVWNPLDKQEVLNCEALIINPGKVPEGLDVFRLKYWGSRVLIRETLTQTLRAQGFVGLRFLDPLRYTGIG